MTYKQSLDIAFRYADSEKSDFDYPDMFHTLANEAQMLIATKGDGIMKSVDVEASQTADLKAELPSDFFELRDVADSNGNSVTADIQERGRLILPKAGKYTVTYYALPTIINENTPEDYEYEVPIYTHAAIPYYIAYRLVGTDDAQLYTALENQWGMYMSIFKQTGKARVKKIVNVYDI